MTDKPAFLAQRLAGGRFREETAMARVWLGDGCLDDGRRIPDIAAVDVWALIAERFDGGVEAFIDSNRKGSDGQ